MDTQARAGLALIERELARRRMADFCAYTYPGWQTGPHHALLCDVADRIISGELKRVLISLPPRHTKSEIFSIRLPAKYLAHNPTHNIIHASYASDLSNGFSYQVRDLIRGDLAYKRLFPHVQLDADRQRLDNWRTIQGGSFKSIGVGGGLTGHGGHLIIIDDPVKEGDEKSITRLDEIFTWYASAARTRLAPGGAIVIVMTRWHPSDMVGRIIDLMNQDDSFERWEVIELPALAKAGDQLGRKPGQALWPERYDENDLAAIRSLDPRYFESLFQQNPQPEAAKLFYADDFQLLKRTRRTVGRPAFACDLAISEKAANDFTVIGRGCYSPKSGRLYIDKIQRFQREWPDVKQTLLQLLDRYPDHDLVFPKHTYELLAVQELRRERPAAAGRIKQVEKMSADKRSNASVLAARARSRRVFVEDTPEGRHLITEHDRFPDRNDDCVDMTSVLSHHFGLSGEFDALVSAIPDSRISRRERLIGSFYALS
jgi:hypothetical protein